MDKETTTTTGRGAEAPPTVKRADPLGWAKSSALLGLAFGSLALALLWRKLPGLAAPPWPLADQLRCWAAAAVGAIASGSNGFDARGCAAAWASLPTGAKVGLWVRWAAAALAACAPGLLLWRGFMAPRDALIHMRGPRRFSGAEALARMRRAAKEQGAAGADHEIAPGAPFTSDAWTKMVLLVAGTGSGKTTMLRPLIRAIVEAGEPLLLFDPKGEFTAVFGAPIIVAPWDARSFAWDIGRDMRNVGDMRRYAESLVEQSTDPMWSNASRQILVGLMRCLRATHGSEWGFQDLADMLGQPVMAMAEVMKTHSPEAARLVEKPTVTTQGILINLAASCAPIFDLAQAWGGLPASRRVSFVEWTLEARSRPQVILQGHASYPALSRSFARPIVEVVSSLVASAEMADGPAGKRWLICDEFPSLGKVDVRQVVSQGRSRNFRCVLACQDFAQLEEIHGPLMVKALTSMVGAIIVGRIGPGDTAEQLAKALGSREVERPNVSTTFAGGPGGSKQSSSMSFARELIPLYLPSELSSRLGVAPDRKGVVMAVVTEGKSFELYWPFSRFPAVRPQSVPARWTLGEDARGVDGAAAPVEAQAPAGEAGTGANARPHSNRAATVDEPIELRWTVSAPALAPAAADRYDHESVFEGLNEGLDSPPTSEWSARTRDDVDQAPQREPAPRAASGSDDMPTGQEEA